MSGQNVTKQQQQPDDLICFDEIETADGSRGSAATFGPSTVRSSGGGDGTAGVSVDSSSGKAEAQWNAYHAAAEGPHVRGEAFARSNEMGAMAEIGTGRAEANAGPLTTSVGLNANTGAKVGTSGAEVNVLGFGLAFGRKTAVNTPLGSIGFKF